jgi:hypothetical protein
VNPTLRIKSCVSLVLLCLIALLLLFTFLFVEMLVPNLLRGRGRSIGADLDVGKEGSE